MNELRHDIQRRVDLIERRLIAMRRLHHDVRDEENAGDNQAEPYGPRNGFERLLRPIAEGGGGFEADEAESGDDNAEPEAGKR
jgi:hypothetical protein